MTRLDAHVAAVRRKLMAGLFINWLAQCALAMAAGAFVVVILGKFLPIDLSWTLLGAAAAVALLLSAAMAYVQRPSLESVAVEIDKRLGLKERFSTALIVRDWNDPFARAAANDAERMAVGIVPLPHFRLSMPRAVYWAIVIAIAALLAVALPSFRGPANRNSPIARNAPPTVADAKKTAEDAIDKIERLPPKVQADPRVRAAKTQLEKTRDQKEVDPDAANRQAIAALAKVDDAVREQAQGSPDEQQAQKDLALMRSLQPGEKDQGPVADAHRQMSEGQFEDAAKTLEDAAKAFKEMPQDQQDAARQQMKKLGEQLASKAQDSRPMEKLAEKLREMEATPQQVKEAQDLTKKAARGDGDAQKKLEQLKKQIAQQRNEGKGADQKQTEQLKQAMEQAQCEAKAQEQAGMLAKLAMRMAESMSAKDLQKLADMAKQMKGSLGNMQQTAQNAQEMAAAKKMIQQAMAEVAAQCDKPGNNPGNTPGKGGSQGEQANQAGRGEQPGQSSKEGQSGPASAQANRADGRGGNQRGNGPAGSGQASGRRADPRQTPFAMKKEKSTSPLNDKGKFLSRQFIQGSALKGESQAEIQKVIESSAAEAAEDMDDARADPRSRAVQAEYFNRLRQEAKKAPSDPSK